MGRPEARDMVTSMTNKFNALGLDGGTVAIKQLAGMVKQQAYILSFIDVFLLLTSLFAMLVVSSFLIQKPEGPAGASGGGH